MDAKTLEHLQKRTYGDFQLNQLPSTRKLPRSGAYPATAAVIPLSHLTHIRCWELHLA